MLLSHADARAVWIFGLAVLDLYTAGHGQDFLTEMSNDFYG